MENDNDLKLKIWDPLNVFRRPADYNHAVIILNRPIQLSYETVFPLWKKAKITVTVDGGTNRWINYIGEQNADILLRGECSDYLPTLVTGDMDSIDSKLLQRLEKTKTKILRTPDQNHTDYTKALKEIQCHSSLRNLRIDGIFVFVETSGRFDHIIANVNTLYKADSLLDPNTEVIQISSDSLTWLLKPGRHKILIPDVLISHKCWCALVPFGTSTSQVCTSGLKWNLDNAYMKFGGLVSTSNTYDGSPEVTVTTTEAIVWSMGVEPLMKMRNFS